MRSRRTANWLLVLAVGALLVACAKANDPLAQAEKKDVAAGLPVPGIAETKALAQEAFIYGLPIVMNYKTMYQYAINRESGQFKAPFNQIHNEARVYTWQDTSVITPNSDTPYSTMFMDLRAEPLVLSVPAVPKSRYYSVMLTDANTFNFGYMGTRATGGEAGDYLVVGPNWKGEAPPGIKQVFRSSTDFAAAWYRTQLFGPDDMPNVENVQAGYKVQPLSAYLKQAPPPPAPAIDWPKIDDTLMKSNFFAYLDFMLAFAPSGPEEVATREKVARMGIGAGRKFDFKDLSLEHKAEVALGMKAGEEKVKDYLLSGIKRINGWGVVSPFGDRAFFNGDWLLRAAAAAGGIYGNDAAEAVYPFTKTMADGTELDGAKHRYTLTFPAGQMPPVNAFWSVTMYGGKTQLLIKNPIDRYLVNSPMLPKMKKNKDGSLTIYLQKDSPGKDKESNWLPAPDGPIYLVMRLYWPRTEPPSVLPAGEGSWQPPAITVSK